MKLFFRTSPKKHFPKVVLKNTLPPAGPERVCRDPENNRLGSICFFGPLWVPLYCKSHYALKVVRKKRKWSGKHFASGRPPAGLPDLRKYSILFFRTTFVFIGLVLKEQIHIQAPAFPPIPRPLPRVHSTESCEILHSH